MASIKSTGNPVGCSSPLYQYFLRIFLKVPYKNKDSITIKVIALTEAGAFKQAGMLSLKYNLTPKSIAVIRGPIPKAKEKLKKFLQAEKIKTGKTHCRIMGHSMEDYEKQS